MSVVFTGDIILDTDEPVWPYFEPTSELLQSADVVVGQVEKVLSARGSASSADAGAVWTGRDPGVFAALPRVNVTVATLAGNHVFDAGTAGVVDTIEALEQAGVRCAGAGLNLAAAREPVIVERGGLRLGFLSYNAVGPKETWATEKKAGAAYIWTLSHYEVDIASPGMELPRVWSFADPDSLTLMAQDIAQCREQCDVVSVSIHKGLVHSPGKLAMYERPVAHAAIDAGADIVIGHHAHVLHGVEVYRGRPIFHGLNNYVSVTEPQSRFTENWQRRRRSLSRDGFTPDPAYATYPYHPDSRMSALGRCTVNSDGVQTAALVPVWMKPPGIPTIATGERAGEVVDYLERLQESEELQTPLHFDGGEVRFL